MPRIPSPPLSDLGRVGFIGAGRLGQTLAVAFSRVGVEILAAHSRTRASAQSLAQRLAAPAGFVVASPAEVVERCDSVFVTVSDDAIAPVAQDLPWRPGQLAVHCSGATELQSLGAAALRGAVPAGFHPLHTFGDVETALAGLPGCSVAVECAEASRLVALKALAEAIGTRPFELPPGARALYHASAHYAGSLVVTLLDEAVRHWARFGVGPQAALQALLPLLRSTVRAIESRGLGPGMAGVAARGDALTLEGHLEALAGVGPQELALYAQLTRRSVRLAAESGRITPAQEEALGRVLEQAHPGDRARRMPID